MTMKKLLLACCLGTAVIAAYAQPQPQGQDLDKRVSYLQKSLQLNDAQAQKIKPILQQSEQQRQALMDKYKPQFQAFHDDMKNLKDQTHSQLAGVLTPAQLQALEAQEKAHKHFGGGRGHGGHPGHRPEGGKTQPPAAE